MVILDLKNGGSGSDPYGSIYDQGLWLGTAGEYAYEGSPAW